MIWRFVSFGIWTTLVVIILLGSLGVIGRNFAGLAFLIATVAEVVSLIRKSSKQTPAQAAAAPATPLDGEMIRTQDRGYLRAWKRFQAGAPVRYDEIEVQLAGTEAFCRLLIDPPAERDELTARRDLQRAATQLAGLRRLAPDFDNLLREREVTYVLSIRQAGCAVPWCIMSDQGLQWAGS